MAEYLTRCPVCGAERAIQAEFLSASQDRDGRVRVSCAGHTSEEISAVWHARNPEASR